MAVDCVPHAAYPVRRVGTDFRSKSVVKSHDVRTGDVSQRDPVKGRRQVRAEFLPVISNGPVTAFLLFEPRLIQTPPLTESGTRPRIGVRQPL